MFFSTKSVRLTSLAVVTLCGTVGFWFACNVGESSPSTSRNDNPASDEPAKPPIPILPFEKFSEGLATSGTWLGYPKFFDFNADGRSDIIASNRMEDGYSIWEAPADDGPWILRNTGIPRDMMYGSAAAGDFDEDGDLDVAINAHSNGLRIFLNDGKLNWTETQERPVTLELMLDLSTGDLNGDGHVDVAGIGHFKGGVSLYLGDGKGNMARMPESMSLAGGKTFGREITLTDLDLDGVPDVVTTTNVGVKALLTRRENDSWYWEDISEGLPNPSIGNSVYAVETADFDEDGVPEIVACTIPSEREPEDRNTIGVYRWNAEKGAWDQIDQGLPHDPPYRDIECGDLDQDGHVDILAMDVDNGPVVYLGDGKGGFVMRGRLDCTGRGRADLGDANADGWLDVVIAYSAKNEAEAGVRVFLNRPEIWAH